MRTIVEAARTLLICRNLPKPLWAEAVNTAVHVLNRTMRSNVEGKTPYQVWFNKNINLNYLKIFGTKCHVHMPKQNRRKWDAKSKEGYFVGYDGCTKGYRIWFPNVKKIETHRDVVFESEHTIQSMKNDEQEGQCIGFEEDSQDEDIDMEEEDEQNEEKDIDTEETQNDGSEGNMTEDEENEEKDVSQDMEEHQENNEHGNPHPTYTLRDRQTINPPDRYGNFFRHSSLITQAEQITSYEEAMQGNESPKWKKAMREELEALTKNQTWKLVEPPRNDKILDNKWVLKIKSSPDGGIGSFKARLVARGFKQEKGQDYDEIFSPVARFESIRTILAIAAAERMHKIQIDVETAFLNGTLEKEVYMEQPKGFEDGTGRVCKLQKSLYGLKQAARCWNSRLVEILREIGMYQTKSDPSVFINKDRSIIIAIFVDDGIIVSKDKENIAKIIRHLKRKVEVKTSELSLFLGLF